MLIGMPLSEKNKRTVEKKAELALPRKPAESHPWKNTGDKTKLSVSQSQLRSKQHFKN
ncbi:hypothetical protein [Cohnella silvisoli]|uniref:Uncharacterized protein n=1 Tax=Cohnella silvisoli TaxID=2873699 RepID=A0ABV1KY80_9BACL|nr:hypothetical protein [Cohnella silvisoli]MCD9021889.1 hypothetical protein [Cohnella silvisoli]